MVMHYMSPCVKQIQPGEDCRADPNTLKKLCILANELSKCRDA